MIDEETMGARRQWVVEVPVTGVQRYVVTARSLTEAMDAVWENELEPVETDVEHSLDAARWKVREVEL